jgi:fatty-acyl-CoA synthase
MLYQRLDEEPDRRAFAWYSPSEAFSWMSFENLMTRAAGHAAYLAEAGLRSGDVCAIVLPSEVVTARLALSVLLLGATPLLIAPPLLQSVHSTLFDTLRHTVRKTRARIVLLPSGMADRADQLPRRGETKYLFGDPPSAAVPASVLPRVAPDETDVVAMQLTSGTTGRPRICVWRHRNVIAGLAGMRAAMRVSSEDICFNWTPLYHDMGLMNNFLLCLAHRVPLVMLNPLEFVKRPALWLRGLSATGSTVTWSPNFGFAISAQRVSDDELSGVDLSHVRAFWNAAERIHLETMQAFHRRFAPYGVRYAALKTNFGCAENVGGATFSDPDGIFPVEFVDRDLLQRRRIARVTGPVNGGAEKTIAIVGVGRPYPGMQIHILSRTGNPMPDGKVGEIALDTPSRMSSYLGDAASTRRALPDGLLRTGDLGYLRGAELFWVGRVKERITVRGRKLDPSDFEPILLRVEGLRHGSFATFGVDSAGRGTQQVVIVAEIRDPPGRSTTAIAEDIRREVFIHLGVTADEVLLVGPGTLTKTSSGKRRHRHFRRLYLDGRLHSFVIDQAAGGS